MVENFLIEIGKEQDNHVRFTNSQIAICLAKNLVFRIKRIELKCHHIHQLIDEDALSLKKILHVKNPINTLTMVVTIEKLQL